MSKTTQQIAEDCGINGANLNKEFARIIEGMVKPLGEYEEGLHEIIGALYRRIEKLEEQKDCECGWAAAKEWESEFNKTKTQLDRADREIERLNLMVSMLSKEEV